MQLFIRKDGYDRPMYEIVGGKVNGRWSNFSGREDRNFGKQGFDLDLIDAPDVAEALQEAGFKVSIRTNDRDPQATPYTHMTVLLPYFRDPNKEWLCPKVRVISNGVMNDLDIDTIGSLDNAIIEECNLTIRLRTGTYQNRPFSQAQLIDGTFYISGTRNYVPSYQKQEERYQRPAEPVNKDDDLPF